MLITMLAAIDIDTILQVGVFLFIIISTLAGQIFSKNQRGAGKAQRKPRPGPQQSRPGPQQSRPGPQRPESRPQPTQVDQRPQAHPWDEPIEVRLPRETVRQTPVLAEPVRADVIPVEPVVVRESIAEHVQRHIESGGIDASRGQSKVEQADERMSSHLHEAFDHRLGRLEGEGVKLSGTTVAAGRAASKTTQPPPAPSEIATRIAQMMRTPADLSAAIVLNEILKRPEERWNE
jgi:hypothetical protein